MADRAHASVPVTDSAGNLVSFVTVTLVESATGALPVGVNFYARPIDGDPITFPVSFRPGIIELWSDTPVRVNLVVSLPNNAVVGYEGVDLNPRSDDIMSAPGRMKISYNDPSQSSALVSTGMTSAAFQIIAPTLTHQHQGDSLNSVVLTAEDAKDFNPQQTWIGYHAGENTAFDTTGSTAVGFQSVMSGAQTTILGNGSALGDNATLITTQNSSCGEDGTVIGADNIATTATDLTLVGSDNTITGTPANTTVLGSNNTYLAQFSTYLGDAHTVDTSDQNHVLLGHANKLYPLPVSQVPVRSGFGLGTTAVAANNGSGTDWFGGGSWYPSGYNDEAATASSGMIQSDVVANLMFQVGGNASLGKQSTVDGTTGTLGFFGATPATRTAQTGFGTDTTSNPIPALSSLVLALHSLGLIRDGIDSTVSIDMTQADGTALEFATTGQALQWSNPVGSTGYQATNPFVFAGGSVSLVDPTASQQFGVFASGDTDTSVSARITFDPVGVSGILIRSFLNLSGGHAAIDGLLVGKTGIFQVSNGVVGSSLASYSALPSTATLSIQSTGTTIKVYDLTSGASVLKTTLTSSYNQTKVKVGFMLSKTSSIASFNTSTYYASGYGFGPYGSGPYGG